MWAEVAVQIWKALSAVVGTRGFLTRLEGRLEDTSPANSDELVEKIVSESPYEMYAKKYQEMAAAYPQVLIAQRTLMQLEVSYVTALETFAMSSVSLQSYLLTDGLNAPSQPGGIDQPVREVNIPFQMGTSPQEK